VIFPSPSIDDELELKAPFCPLALPETFTPVPVSSPKRENKIGLQKETCLMIIIIIVLSFM
jgi:hypothetical protein